MELPTIELIRERLQHPSLLWMGHQAVELANFVRNNDLDIEDGMHFYFSGQDELDLLEVYQYIGHDCLEASRIRGIVYSATAEVGYTADSLIEDVSKFDGSSILDVLEDVARDRGKSLEHPNNFIIKVIIDLDNETTVTYHHECDEQPAICHNCDANDDLARSNFSNGYSCDHIEDSVHTTVSMHIEKRLSDEEVEEATAFI